MTLAEASRRFVERERRRSRNAGPHRARVTYAYLQHDKTDFVAEIPRPPEWLTRISGVMGNEGRQRGSITSGASRKEPPIRRVISPRAESRRLRFVIPRDSRPICQSAIRRTTSGGCAAGAAAFYSGAITIRKATARRRAAALGHPRFHRCNFTGRAKSISFQFRNFPADLQSDLEIARFATNNRGQISRAPSTPVPLVRFPLSPPIHSFLDYARDRDII